MEALDGIQLSFDLLGIQIGNRTQESTEVAKEKTFTMTFWCKNCHKESDYIFPVGTDIRHSRLVGDGTVNTIIGNKWIELRCKMCKVGSLF